MMQTDPSFELPELPPLPELAAIDKNAAKNHDDAEPFISADGSSWVPVTVGDVTGHYCPQQHTVATNFDVRVDSDGARTVFATGVVRIMTPTAFECLGGKENNRKWRLSIRVLLQDGKRGTTLGNWLTIHQLDGVGPAPPPPSSKKQRKKRSVDSTSEDPDYSSSQDTGSGPSSPGKRPLKHASGPQGGRLSKIHRPTVYEPQLQDEFNEFDPADLIGNFMSDHLMSEFCGAPPAPSIPPATAQLNSSLLADAAQYSLPSVFLSAQQQQTPPLTMMAAGHGLVPAPGHLVALKDEANANANSEPDIERDQTLIYAALLHDRLVDNPELAAKMGLSAALLPNIDHMSTLSMPRAAQQLEAAPFPTPPQQLQPEVRPAGITPVKQLQGMSPGLQIAMDRGHSDPGKYTPPLKTPPPGCGASFVPPETVYHVQVQTSTGSEGGSDGAACVDMEEPPRTAAPAEAQAWSMREMTART